MHPYTTKIRLNKIITINLQLLDIIQMLSKLNLLLFSLVTLFACIVEIEHMTIKPLSILP